MNPKPARSYIWVYYLTFALFSLAVMLRMLIAYNQIPVILIRDLFILAAFIALFLAEPNITSRWQRFFPVYLLIQMVLICLLMLSPGIPDYFAILFSLLSMRIFQQLSPRPGVIWVAIFTVLTILTLYPNTGLTAAFAFALIYIAANVLTSLFSLNTRRANEAHLRNQAMQAELHKTIDVRSPKGTGHTGRCAY